ncbi:hypothetical protein GIB67_012457 [Kingdonia uniflora]|uniref:Hyaluronan/mRNA-binding protein domain-containing protein n=1 Tax=Kingdonia uniflora TaxID=39325 RepID=A0A7J7MVF0_9MAGN|nr:hypothetical protein GIB67_012457 [Kingdonia uniflora]
MCFCAFKVRDARTDGRGGGGRDGGRGSGRGRGTGGFNRDRVNNENSYGGFNRDRVNNNENGNSNNGVSGGFGATEDGEVEKNSERRGYSGPRGPYRANHRGGYSNGEVAEGGRPRRPFERRSGTGRGNELKREGSGKGNWGSAGDENVQETEEPVNESEKSENAEKQPVEDAVDANKEKPTTEVEEKEKEPEDKEMTLEEYQKVYEEKRKALLALKAEERKVDVDKDLQSMQQLSSKKTNDEIFIKLGSDKDKRKEIADKDEKAKKSISINEFLKPAEGEKYYSPGGRGRGGRGRGPRGGSSSGGRTNVNAPLIDDDELFPTLGGGK